MLYTGDRGLRSPSEIMTEICLFLARILRQHFVSRRDEARLADAKQGQANTAVAHVERSTGQEVLGTRSLRQAMKEATCADHMTMLWGKQ